MMVSMPLNTFMIPFGEGKATVQNARQGFTVEINATGSHAEFTRPAKGELKVSYIESKKRGDGLKLYNYALKVACNEGRALVSDRIRSRFAERVWQEQQRKGRAVCDESYTREGVEYHHPMRELESKLYAGKISQEDFDKIVSRLPEPSEVGHWGCGRYIVQNPCVSPGFSFDGLGQIGAFFSGLFGLSRPRPRRRRGAR